MTKFVLLALLIGSGSAHASWWVACEGKTKDDTPFKVEWLVGSRDSFLGAVDVQWGKQARFLATRDEMRDQPPLAGVKDKKKRTRVEALGYFSHREEMRLLLADPKRDEVVLFLKADKNQGEVELDHLFGPEKVKISVRCYTEG